MFLNKKPSVPYINCGNWLSHKDPNSFASLYCYSFAFLVIILYLIIIILNNKIMRFRYLESGFIKKIRCFQLKELYQKMKKLYICINKNKR